MMEELHRFTCPCCWQQISMTLDLSAGGQTYIEDCEVCCNPLQISYDVQGHRVANFHVEAAQD